MGGESPRHNNSCQSVIVNGGGGIIISQTGGSNNVVRINSGYQPAHAFPPPPIFIPQNFVPSEPIRKYTKVYRGQDLRGKKVRFDIVK